MRFRITLVIVIFISSLYLTGFGQFFGGRGDGYVQGYLQIHIFNNQPGYCSGGAGDGYHQLWLLATTFQTQLLYCSGGAGDGYHQLLLSGANFKSQADYCSGGTGDGYHQLFLPPSVFQTQLSYCSGGTGDGWCQLLLPGTIFKSQQHYCSGGPGDGYYQLRLPVTTLSSQVHYCSGGSGDGYHQLKLAATNFQSQQHYCSGGPGDGYYQLRLPATTLPSQVHYCSGGNGDGYFYLSVSPVNFQSNLFCYGGTGDGYHTSVSGTLHSGTGVWKGIVSSLWTDSLNWVNNVVPDTGTFVFIPAGCNYYPLLSGTLAVDTSAGAYFCKGISVSDGAMLRNTGSALINGRFVVAGQYIADNNTDKSQQVHSQGSLEILPSGTIRLGNQDSGTGLCDLTVNAGGKLSLEGGFLDVDDQLNILDGGQFTMTCGQVFAHKHGVGSDIGPSHPGAFYIAPMASGSISGGKVKVCGKQTVSGYAAVNLLSSSLSFQTDAILELTLGDAMTTWDVDIKTAENALMNHLYINKPGNIVSLITDAIINGNLVVFPGSVVRLNPGVKVRIEGALILQSEVQ